MRAVPAAPADVVADAVLRDALERVVERVDAQLRPAPVVLDTCRPATGSSRTRASARRRRPARSRPASTIALYSSCSASASAKTNSSSVVVVLVLAASRRWPARRPAGTRRPRRRPRARPCRLAMSRCSAPGRTSIGPVQNHFMPSGGASGSSPTSPPPLALAVLVLELLVELVVEAREVLAVAARRQDARAVELDHARLEPAHPLVEVGDPGRLAHLAVVDDVDAGLRLAAYRRRSPTPAACAGRRPRRRTRRAPWPSGTRAAQAGGSGCRYEWQGCGPRLLPTSVADFVDNLTNK